PGRSEAILANPILDWVMAQRNMVVATTFASNIARLKTLSEAAIASGRKVCLLGRAMRKMVGVGLETGVLTDFPDTIGPEEAANLPRNKVM
ncbi:ribonuclease J, partial [Streptococcus pneumoniae]|nr:ribonuclease J [Streptococcus pneumoniae]